jgi:hypothetical protein
MRPPKYPLEPVARVRAQEVDAATRAYGDSVRGREDAQRTRAATEGARDAHDESARNVRAAEEAALERGDLRVADLMQKDAWEHRVAAEKREHERRVADASAREADARDGERTAQGALAARKADEDAVAKHRAGWDAREAKKRDAREEEAASEAWRAKESGPKGDR